jgi:hypothetical protein
MSTKNSFFVSVCLRIQLILFAFFYPKYCFHDSSLIFKRTALNLSQGIRRESLKRDNQEIEEYFLVPLNFQIRLGPDELVFSLIESIGAVMLAHDVGEIVSCGVAENCAQLVLSNLVSDFQFHPVFQLLESF